jgi:hypothetical protein
MYKKEKRFTFILSPKLIQKLGHKPSAELEGALRI